VDPSILAVENRGSVLGGVYCEATLQEASDGKLSKVETIHLEPQCITFLCGREKRMLTINKDPGYGWIDVGFSCGVVFTTLLIIESTHHY